VAQPAWAPARKKGESEAAYKKRYYTAQRNAAEKNKGGSTYKALQKKGYEPAEKSASPAKKRMAAASKSPSKSSSTPAVMGGATTDKIKSMFSGLNTGKGKGGSSERKGKMSVIPSLDNKPQANMFSLPKYKGKGEDPAHNRDTYSRMSVIPSPSGKMSDSAPPKKKKAAS